LIGSNQQNTFNIQNQRSPEPNYHHNQSNFDISFDELNSSNINLIQERPRPYFSPNLQQHHLIQPIFNNLNLQLNNVNLQQTHIFRKGKRVQIKHSTRYQE